MKDSIKNKRIKEIMTGTYDPLSNKIQVGYTTKPVHENRKEGDVWFDIDGKEWIKKNGTIQSISKLAEARIPYFCPDCEKILKSKADEKMYIIHKKCLDCTIDMENQMRIDGTWADYEKEKVKGNALAWIKDQENQFEDWKRSLLENKQTFVNEDGSLEKWENSADIEKVVVDMEKEFGDMKKEIMKNLI